MKKIFFAITAMFALVMPLSGLAQFSIPTTPKPKTITRPQIDTINVKQDYVIKLITIFGDTIYHLQGHQFMKIEVVKIHAKTVSTKVIDNKFESNLVEVPTKEIIKNATVFVIDESNYLKWNATLPQKIPFNNCW